MHKSAIIGFTGFVGGNLAAQYQFSHSYDSKNIEDIAGNTFDLVVCAGARAEKWKINQEPQKDRDNINFLFSNLKKAKTKKLILISTVDVYPIPVDVDEDTVIPETDVLSYGNNRRYLEVLCATHFNVIIVRLPGLFGPGLKKNVIYDFLNDNNLDQINSKSVFQFYNLDNLWRDINTSLKQDLKLVNFATEPLIVSDVAERVFHKKFHNVIKDKTPAMYNFRTKFFRLFGGKNGYIYNQSQVLSSLKKFVYRYKRLQ